MIAVMVTNVFVPVIALIVIEYMMIALIAILSIALCIIIECKLPENEDHIGLREELGHTARIIISFWMMITAFWFSLIWIPEGTLNNVLWLTMILVLRTLFMFLHLKLTRWPLTHFKSIIEGEHCETKMISLAHQNTLKSLEIAQTTLQRSDGDADGEPELETEASPSHRVPSIPTHLEMNYIGTHYSESSAQVIESGDSGSQGLLRQTLKKMEFFDMFMRHCIKEYCTECLLSVTEMAQFQNKIIEENKNTLFDAPFFKIPADCPRAFIVWGERGQSMPLVMSADLLYRKYIKEGSDFEINLRYVTRKRYREQFERDDPNDNVQHLYHIFDECIAEMMQLLKPAFQRFIQTEQYKVSQGRESLASVSATPLTPASQ